MLSSILANVQTVDEEKGKGKDVLQLPEYANLFFILVI